MNNDPRTDNESQQPPSAVYRFEVGIHFTGPVLSHASGSREIGIDTAALRGPGDSPALSGSLIRGNLRHAWSQFHGVKGEAPGNSTAGTLPWNPDYWLGAASPKLSGDRPVRSRLRFDHQWLARPPAEERRARHRIQIDPATGAVARQMLQVIESPFSTGDASCFVGIIEAELANQAEAETLKVRIRKGLEYAASLGAMKTAGFGRIQQVDVNIVPADNGIRDDSALPGLPTDPAPARIGLGLSFDRPVCVARPHAQDNRFESEDHIPGSVLRGAIAARIFTEDRGRDCTDPRFKALCDHFEAFGITHARAVPHPVSGTGPLSPVVPPLSLVEGSDGAGLGDSALYDIALMPDAAGLIHGRAPAFAIDWKSGGAGEQQAARLCGGQSAPRRIDVRTAINQTTGAAMESALFAAEVLLPDDLLWLAEIDLSAIAPPERPAVITALTHLQAEPLRQIGKTKANAEIHLHPAFDMHAGSGSLLRDGLACVCLQSEAWLLPAPHGMPGTGGEQILFERYAQAWQQLSDGALRLKRFFAHQHLVGGGYLSRRFWQDRPAYNPELLTGAGSLFVLEPTGDQDQAELRLQDWRDHGLDQLTEAPGGSDWCRTPYIRQNGYGRVAINLNLHWDLRPSPETWHAID